MLWKSCDRVRLQLKREYRALKIYVIRHGQTEFNIKGLINGAIGDALTPEGEAQAKEAAKSLPHSIKHIYASSLNRAKQTAEILNAERHLPIEFSDDLQEVDFGDLNGTPYLKEYQQIHSEMKYDWHAHGGEDVEDVKKRICRILRRIKAENGDGEALIVGHGGTIRMLHYLESGEPLGEIQNAALFEFDLDKILKNA